MDEDRAFANPFPDYDGNQQALIDRHSGKVSFSTSSMAHVRTVVYVHTYLKSLNSHSYLSTCLLQNSDSTLNKIRDCTEKAVYDYFVSIF